MTQRIDRDQREEREGEMSLDALNGGSDDGDDRERRCRQEQKQFACTHGETPFERGWESTRLERAGVSPSAFRRWRSIRSYSNDACLFVGNPSSTSLRNQVQPISRLIAMSR